MVRWARVWLVSLNLKYLLGLLVLLNIADGVLTNALIESGIGREGNPFLVNVVGEPGFIAIKVLGAALAAFLLWDISRRHPRLARVATGGCLALYGGIVAWNSALLIL